MGNELGRFLEDLRGKMSLRDAAEKSGLSHTYIRDLELGINRKTKAPIRPSADTLKQLATAYGHSPIDLLVKAGYIEESSSDDDNYDSLATINKIVKELGIEQMGFFDIDKWRNLSPEDVDDIRKHFEWVAQKAKERNEEKK